MLPSQGCVKTWSTICFQENKLISRKITRGVEDDVPSNLEKRRNAQLSELFVRDDSNSIKIII